MRAFMVFLVLLLVGVSNSQATNGVPFRVRFQTHQPVPIVIQQDVGIGYYTSPVPLNLGVGYSSGFRFLQNGFYRDAFRFQPFRNLPFRFRGR